MVAVASSLKINQNIQLDLLAHQTIMIVDRDYSSRRTWIAALEKAGIGLILTAADLETARNLSRQHACDLIFIDPQVAGLTDHGFEFIQEVKMQRPRSIVALLTGCPTMGLCFRAARAGVSDLLVKGPHLSPAAEALRMLKNRTAKNMAMRPDAMPATGLFSSVGVTRGELAVLEEFARGYPKQQDIARRLDKDEVYIRKVFSRVYKKLENYLPVNNQAQLSHIMTICSLFG